jgi:Xaa-Pro aminopeptidase
MLPTSRELLEYAGVPATLITNLVNVRYLTGLKLSAGSVLAMPRSYVLFVDDRYREYAMQRAQRGVSVRHIADLEREMRKVPICGFEEDHVTVAELRSWKSRFTETKFVRTSDAVEVFRRQKDDEELRNVRRAHRITQEILRRIPAALRAGISERALAWKIETWAYELGAEGLAFAPIVAFGTHTSRPHHRPTTRTLQKGHIVQIDVGAMYKGYCADRSQVYFTADPTPQQKAALDAVQEALDAAVAAAKPGASTHRIDTIARDVLRKHGMERAFTHALGHGIGLEAHEGIIFSQRRKDEALLEHEVVAIEPGVYFPGKFGIRLEEMVVVS